MSVYISSLPVYTGTAADLRWFIMNNSGETETFKFSGYSSQLIPGTGTNSYRTPTQTASGLRSIAIGEGASASGEDSVSIGNGNNNPTGYRSVIIGRHPYAPGDNNTAIGGGAYIYGNNSIVIGHETSAGSNGIVLGGNTSRAGGNYSITLGNQNEQNNSPYSTILGTNNRVGISPNFFGSQYSVVIGTDHRVECDAGYYYNNIIGGFGNYITGTTSGATLIGLSGYTEPIENDTAYVKNLRVLGQSYQGYFDNGSGSTFTINWNNGNTQKMSFTGAGGITCNNTQTGAHYRMVINNPNGYTPTSFTAAGRTIKFNGGSFVVYSGESICELFITNDSVFVNQLGLFS